MIFRVVVREGRHEHQNCGVGRITGAGSDGSSYYG